MSIPVFFYSYFKDLTGCDKAVQTLPAQSTVKDLLAGLFLRFPKIAPLENSMLVAVGVEYEGKSYVLREGDEVSLFPPVQGG